MILLAKRYHKNPQGGFTTFQMDVQMKSSIINKVAKGFYFFEKGSYFSGTGLMEMFLWTVGSFYVFGEKWDLTWFLPVRSRFFEKTQISI